MKPKEGEVVGKVQAGEVLLVQLKYYGTTLFTL
jgi:hypothetical protein